MLRSSRVKWGEMEWEGVRGSKKGCECPKVLALVLFGQFCPENTLKENPFILATNLIVFILDHSWHPPYKWPDSAFAPQLHSVPRISKLIEPVVIFSPAFINPPDLGNMDNTCISKLCDHPEHLNLENPGWKWTWWDPNCCPGLRICTINLWWVSVTADQIILTQPQKATCSWCWPLTKYTATSCWMWLC